MKARTWRDYTGMCDALKGSMRDEVRFVGLVIKSKRVVHSVAIELRLGSSWTWGGGARA